MTGKSSSPPAFDASESVWLLGAFCALQRLAFDPALFVREHPGPLAADELSVAASGLGLTLEWRSASLAAVLCWRLPLAVNLREPSGSRAGTMSWALVLNADERSAFVLERGAAAPGAVQLTELRRRYGGSALSLTPQVECAADPDDIARREARFGLRWFGPEILRHRSVWRDVLAASLVMQLIGFAVPLFTQVIIDKVIVHHTASTLIALGIAMTVFMLFTSLLAWLRQYLILHAGQRIDAVLGAQVFDRLFRLPLLYFQHRPTGVIAARLQGIDTIREFLASAAVTLALDLPLVVLFVGIMLWYSAVLTVLVLGILAVVAAMSLLVAPLFQQRLDEQFRRGAANQAFLTEYVAGIETVKSLQFEPQLNRRYRGLLAGHLRAGFATRQLANTYGAWANGLEQLMTLGILVIGAWIVMSGTSMTIGMLVAFQMFANRISQPMLRMVGLWQQWQQTRLAIARLGDIMNAPAEPCSVRPRRAPVAGAGAIEIENLSFRYGERLPLLYEHLSLRVAPGQLVALMGPSGSGKSTLARLLQGFHAPASGRIRIDGVDIDCLSANELRAMFGIVPQETVLFSGSLLENLELANPAASFEQVVAACRMAEIHATIEALPEGYRTTIGERGVGLSGGQRQRLAIARALLKGPRILIFDEATAGLDPPTAEQLGRTISTLRGHVSILFIAHHLPRTLQVDHIVRLGEKLSVVTSAGRNAGPEPGAPLGQGMPA